MKIALWVFQVLLAIVYGMDGFRIVFQTKGLRAQMARARGESSSSLIVTGVSESFLAAGMIFPLLIGVLPWLTSIAAIGLTLVQIVEIITVFILQQEYRNLLIHFPLLALSVFIIVGRWQLVIFAFQHFK